MSDLQIFVLPDDGGEELIGDEFLDELWHATARAPRPYPGAYAFGADVLGASRVLNAEMRVPGSTGTRPSVLAEHLKSVGQRAIDAGRRAVASSRRYAAGRKIGQKAIDAGQKAVAAGQKTKAAVEKTAKDALKAAASAPPPSKSPSKAVTSGSKRNLAAAAAATAATRSAPAKQPSRAFVQPQQKTFAPVAQAKTPVRTVTVPGKRTLMRGDVLGADSATPEALEAAAAAWTILADAVDRMNVAGEAAVQVAQQADEAGIDTQAVWDALAAAFADERSAKGFATNQGFVVTWTSYGFGPEIGEGAAEAKSTADQWISNVEGLLQPIRDQLASATAPQDVPPTSGPLPFDPGSPGGYGSGSGSGAASDPGFDPYESGSDESEALQAFRESGGAWDPFEEEEAYATEAADEIFDEMEIDAEYDSDAAEALLEEEDFYSMVADVDSGDLEFSPRREARAAAVADSFETDEDAQAFVARRSLLEDDSAVNVDEALAGLDFEAKHLFLPHTAITDWQQEQREQLEARNTATEKAQIADAKARAADAALRSPPPKLSPAVAMRLAAARRRLAEQQARLDALAVDENEVE